MEVLDIYRREPDGSLSWITTASSMKTARMIIRARAANRSEEFLIHDHEADETIILRADGCWFHQKAETEAGNSNLSNSVGSSPQSLDKPHRATSLKS